MLARSGFVDDTIVDGCYRPKRVISGWRGWRILGQLYKTTRSPSRRLGCLLSIRQVAACGGSGFLVSPGIRVALIFAPQTQIFITRVFSA